MKEVYEAPEVKLVCFVSDVKLANGIIDFDSLITLNGKGDPTKPSDGDIDIGV